MTIADAPLWAQTPTAEIVRDVNGSEPGPVVVLWHETDCTSVAVDAAKRMTVPEARKLWVALGELLAIEAVDPRDTQVSADPWMTDTDGSRSRFKRTPPVSAGAQSGDKTAISVNVELYDDVNRPGRPDALDDEEILLDDGHGSSIGVDSPTDARALAFALFKAARVVEMATAAEVMQP